MSHGHLHHRTGPPAPQESTFHVHKPSLYLSTLLKLVVLMVLTVILAQVPFPDLNLGVLTIHGTIFNNVVAMTIAVLKALLVLSFFMGFKYATRLTRLWAMAGFIGFSLMFLTLGDYSTRRYEPTPRWSADPGSSLQRSVHESREKPEFRSIEHTGRF